MRPLLSFARRAFPSLVMAMTLAFGTAVPLPAAFTTAGRALLRDGAAFTVRGVDYQPTPIGDNPSQSPPYGDYYTANYAALHARDLPLLRAMGANVIRIYGWEPTASHAAFLDACYNGGVNPIFVLVNRWIDPATNWGSTTAVNAIRNDFLTLEANLANHPAVLGLILGNETNAQNGNGTNAAFWTAINSIAAAIKQQNPARLVSMAITDALAQVSARDAAMTALDFWSVQVYRGTTFGSFFTQYAAASARPLLITEFGLDAFNQTTGQPYPNNAELVGETVAALWSEIAANAATCAGGCVFAFTDEWWKSAGGSASVQDHGGFPLGSVPDGFLNEEWWGLFAVADNGALPDVLTPRATVARLQALWAAPGFATHPADASTTYLDDPTFTVAVTGSPAPTLRWQISTNNGASYSDIFDDATYGGATGAALTITDVTVAMHGHRFRAIATNTNGSTPSQAAALSVARAPATIALSQLVQTYTGTPLAPTATTAPAGLAVELTFSGSATVPSAAGIYTLVATVHDANHEGAAQDTFVISPSLQLDPGDPVVTTAGGSTVLGVTAAGGPTATSQWQWQPTGGGTFSDVPGATSATYAVPSSQRFHAGAYRAIVTMNGATATSGTVAVSIAAPPSNDARLLNLSTRGLAGADANQLFPGFVVSGSGTKRLLVRAIGPTLNLPPINFAGGTIPDPTMVLKRFNFATNTYDDVHANDDWANSTNAADITSTAAELFAFTLQDAKDAALLVDLPAGQYAVVAGEKEGGDGIAIVELYDADPETAAARLINISNRGFCGTGDQVMIPGFVISNDGPRTLLVRVVGPTLASPPYNVPGTMADPLLNLYRRNFTTNTDDLLLTQDDWGDNPDAAYTSQIAAQVFAFALDADGADAAFVVTLEPGVYSVVGASADGVGTGVVLVEVYVVP